MATKQINRTRLFWQPFIPGAIFSFFGIYLMGYLIVQKDPGFWGGYLYYAWPFVALLAGILGGVVALFSKNQRSGMTVAALAGLILWPVIATFLGMEL